MIAALIVASLCIAAVALLWPVFAEDDPSRRIHRAQQRALRRHHRMMRRRA